MAETENIQAALKSVKFPGFSRDIVSFGLVREIEQTGEDVQVGIAVSYTHLTLPTIYSV